MDGPEAGACFGGRSDRNRKRSLLRPRNRQAKASLGAPEPGREVRSLLRPELSRRNRRSLLRRESRSGTGRGFAFIKARDGRSKPASVGCRKAERSEPASIGGRTAEDRGSLRSRPTAKAEGLAPMPEPNGTGSEASASGWNRRRPIRAPAPAGNRKGSRPGRKAWCETPKGSPRASARRAPTGERHEARFGRDPTHPAGAATRPGGGGSWDSGGWQQCQPPFAFGDASSVI